MLAGVGLAVCEAALTMEARSVAATSSGVKDGTIFHFGHKCTRSLLGLGSTVTDKSYNKLSLVPASLTAHCNIICKKFVMIDGQMTYRENRQAHTLSSLTRVHGMPAHANKRRNQLCGSDLEGA